MANSYYSGTTDVSNGSVSDESDINSLDTNIIAAFDLVEAAVTAATTTQSSVNAQQYAVGSGNIYDQVTPNDTNPTYSAKTHALNAKYYGSHTIGVDIQNLVVPVTGVATYSAKHYANAASTSAAAAAADLVLTNADVVSTNADVVSTNADVVLAQAAAATIPSPTASGYGQLIVQNDADTAFEMLAQGTSGYVLKSNGADALPAFVAQTTLDPYSFSTTVPLVFYQASAPTGWVEVVTQADSALRVVTVASTTGGSVGGASDLSSGCTTVAAHTHTVGSAGAHVHDIPSGEGSSGSSGCLMGNTAGSQNVDVVSNGAHQHTLSAQTNSGTWIPKYADVIVCKRS